MSALQMMIAGALHPMAPQQTGGGEPGAVPTVVQSTFSTVQSAIISLVLPAAPTPGNYLVAMAVEAHTEYGVSFDYGTWDRVAGATQQASSVGCDLWVHKVESGDSASLTITRSSSHYATWALFEVDGASGVVSGVVYNVGFTSMPVSLVIPAGAANALPVFVFGDYNAASFQPYVASTGWTVQEQSPGHGGANYVQGLFATRDAASDGSAITVIGDSHGAVPARGVALAFLVEPA